MKDADPVARRWPRLLFMCLAFAWLVFTGWRAYSGWPAIPLDMSAGDPDVEQAYQAAVTTHVLNALLVGLTPLILSFAILRLARR